MPRGHAWRAIGALLAAVLVVAGALAPRSRACELCREDKIAATYDWNVVAAAKRHEHTVVFAAIEGRLTPGDKTPGRVVARRLAALPDVDTGTVRVSLAPPAASFACDPAHDAPRRLIAAANRALASSGLALTIVQVGAPGDAPPPAPRASR
jgi:hypothetical protein